MSNHIIFTIGTIKLPNNMEALRRTIENPHEFWIWIGLFISLLSSDVNMRNYIESGPRNFEFGTKIIKSMLIHYDHVLTNEQRCMITPLFQ